MKKKKDTPKKKNMLNRKEKMTTNQIVILNQEMRSLPIINLMTRKLSIPEMTPQLKMLKNKADRLIKRLSD